MRNLIKAKIKTIIGTILGVLFVTSIIQLIRFEFYPWINVSIVSGLPLTTYLLSFLITEKKIIGLKLLYSIITIQFFAAIYFLSNPLLLKEHWDLLLIPTYIFIVLLFIELAKRKTKIILNSSYFCISILLLLIPLKFVYQKNVIDLLLIGIILCNALLLIFSKNKLVDNMK